MSEKKAKVSVDLHSDGKGVGMTIDALFKGMEGLVKTKTVVGEPFQVGEATIVPLVEVSAGLASGALTNAKGAGAMSAKISPVAVLVIENGRTRLVNVKNQDIFTRLLDLVPEAIDKVTKGSVSSEARAEAERTAQSMDVEIIDADKPED